LLHNCYCKPATSCNKGSLQVNQLLLPKGIASTDMLNRLVPKLNELQ